MTTISRRIKPVARIALSIPDENKPDRHFSLRLKQDIVNEPCEFKMPSKIIVVSDIEGNFVSFLDILLANQVIDRYMNWIFDEGHLVIVGDCFDRGEQVIECLWLIYSLEDKARKKGGYVHFILGNHEIMNMNGDWRYVHPNYARSRRFPYTALYNANFEIWHWLRTKNVIEKIGDLLFVHGGIAEELLRLNISIAEINEHVRPYYSQADSIFDDPLLMLVFQDNRSPFWYRGYYIESQIEQLIDDTLNQFEVRRIVTGHTLMEHVSSFYNGKVINVDTDHSSKLSEGLLIKQNKFYRVDQKGKRHKI